MNDNSSAGDYRLSNVRGPRSFVDCGCCGLASPEAAGTGKWSESDPFSGVQSDRYWSSTTRASDLSFALRVDFSYGFVTITAKDGSIDVWPVRGGN